MNLCQGSRLLEKYRLAIWRRKEGLFVGPGNIEKAKDGKDVRQGLHVPGEAPESLGERAVEYFPIQNENDAVVVRSELLKVFFEEGKLLVSLLENFARFTVKTELSQSSSGEEGCDSKKS